MGFLLAIGLTAFQFMHFTIRTRSVRSFPVQVRLGYLLLLLNREQAFSMALLKQTFLSAPV
jgi:hypothetical protein